MPMVPRLIAIALLSLAAVGAASAQPAPTARPTGREASVARAVEQVRQLPGRATLLITENGREIGAHDADDVLAVGSSFKMAVLLALRKQIEAGTRRWDEVVALQPLWKTPGSAGSDLSDWPDGTLFTIQTLAGFMIATSDNTGTDSIMHVVGRENIEPFAGRNRPMLTTRDLFMFKNPAYRAYLDRWRNGDEAARRAVLRELESLPLLEEGYLEVPYALDAEWFFSNRELCGLIEQVADLPVMQIRSPATRPGDWEIAAFKGGSEPGVLAGTTWVKAADGRTYCVSMTWNNEQTIVDQRRFVEILTELFAGLKQP